MTGLGNDRRAWFTHREQELRQIGQRLDVWRRAAARVQRDRRQDFERGLDHLRGLLNRAVGRLEAVRRVGDDTWRNARVAADAAVTALSESYQEFETRFVHGLAV